MSEKDMPVAEAELQADDSMEESAYELAFHVLPTVADGEVAAVFESLKNTITSSKGTLTDEEAPERIDLAYEIVINLEGKNRKFESAYFGWIRFSAVPSAIADITEAVDNDVNILRHLLIRLTRVEEETPFRYHEALKDQKMVTDVEESEVVPDFTTVAAPVAATETEATKEVAAEVDEKELDKALEEKEV